MQKLAKVTENVAAYRIREMKNLQPVEKLATWMKTYGYDREDKWMHGTRPLSPQEFTSSLWSELNALRDAISTPEGDGLSQRNKSFIKEIVQGTANLTDAEFAMLKRLVEKRDRDAAHATVAPVDTAQYRSPGSLTLEILSDVYVDMGGKSEEGWMNPEPTELESPSAGTGLNPSEPSRVFTDHFTDHFFFFFLARSSRGVFCSSLPSDQIGGGFLVCYFFLFFSSFYLFFWM